MNRELTTRFSQMEVASASEKSPFPSEVGTTACRGWVEEKTGGSEMDFYSEDEWRWGHRWTRAFVWLLFNY